MDEALDDGLERHLREVMRGDGRVTTVARGQVHRIADVSAEGVTISTDASDAEGPGAQVVPAWMINVAWHHLQANGSLSNRHLVSSDGLNVKRSSVVCALLATIPGVSVTSTQPIVLGYEA